MLRTVALVLTVVFSDVGAYAAEPALDNDTQRTLYALGMAISSSLGTFNLTPDELEVVKSGITDGVLKKPPRVDMQTFGPKLQALAKERAAAGAAGEKKSSEDFLAKAATEKGAKKTASGLVYSEITPGKGDSPKATDKVKVHYEGKLIDGTVFDSSYKDGTPITFILSQVVPGWTEGLQLMRPGDVWELTLPPELGYGEQDKGPIPANSTLIFKVELLDVFQHPG